jgi:hypothetical protein
MTRMTNLTLKMTQWLTDSVDALPDFFTEHWDVLEEEQDETVDI